MSKHETIVTPSWREALQAGARANSEYNWKIADAAVETLARFLEKQDQGIEPFIHYTRGDVYMAISHYCCKSPQRVRVIAGVGAIFRPELRRMIEAKYGEWAFGYYEALTPLPASQWDDIFQFLKDYQAGVIAKPPRRLGVGEFIFLFEKHILGAVKETEVPEQPDIDSETIPSSLPSIPFQDILRTSSRLERSLKPYADRPGVVKFLFHLKGLKDSLPEAMRECGINVPVDKVSQKA